MPTNNVFNAADTKDRAFRAKGGSDEVASKDEEIHRNEVQAQDAAAASAASPSVEGASGQGAAD